MRPNHVKTLWSQNKPVVCGWINTDATLIAEIYGQSGMEAVLIDMQHGTTSMQELPKMLQAVSATPAMPFVRPTSIQPAEIMKVLDMGAYGLIVPLVDNAEQAQRFVHAACYPPRGARSFGPARGRLYGGDDYVDHANDTVIKLPMIETLEGYKNHRDIINVDGVDGVFIGPADLAFALGGTPGPEGTDKNLEEAIRSVRAACHEAGKKIGIFCLSANGAKRRINEGFDLVAPSNDTYVIASSLAQIMAEIKDQ